MTINDIFEAAGGPAALARRIGVTTEHAAAMKRRGSIPARYWPALVATPFGRETVTYEQLAGIAASARQPAPETRATA